jgi:hypothetical protein
MVAAKIKLPRNLRMGNSLRWSNHQPLSTRLPILGLIAVAVQLLSY